MARGLYPLALDELGLSKNSYGDLLQCTFSVLKISHFELKPCNFRIDQYFRHQVDQDQKQLQVTK